LRSHHENLQEARKHHLAGLFCLFGSSSGCLPFDHRSMFSHLFFPFPAFSFQKEETRLYVVADLDGQDPDQAKEEDNQRRINAHGVYPLPPQVPAELREIYAEHNDD
jgi:hypothetical protein